MAAAVVGAILMVASFVGGTVQGGINLATQSSQLCSQFKSIGDNTRALNSLMETALQSYEAVDDLLTQQIVQTQMQIADDAQQLAQLQAHYVTTHRVMQIFIAITLIGAAVLLVLKHFGILDWKQCLYVIFSIFTIGILASLLYTYGFAPTCQSTISPVGPTFVLSPREGCPCLSSGECPFGCQVGCWDASLSFAVSGAAGLQLQISDRNGDIVRDVTLPSFATTYSLSAVEGYDYDVLQANLRAIDDSGCPGPWSTLWWINVNDFKSSSQAILRSGDLSTALTSTIDGDGNGSIVMQPYDPTNPPSQLWTLWIDQSVNTDLYVLESQGSKLLGGVTASSSAPGVMVPLSYASSTLCSPNNCGPCSGGVTTYQLTQAFGLYTITDIVGAVAMYYLRADGTYGIWNVQTSTFDASGVSSAQPLTDEDIQPQWRMSYSLS